MICIMIIFVSFWYYNIIYSYPSHFPTKIFRSRSSTGNTSSCRDLGEDLGGYLQRKYVFLSRPGGGFGRENKWNKLPMKSPPREYTVPPPYSMQSIQICSLQLNSLSLRKTLRGEAGLAAKVPLGTPRIVAANGAMVWGRLKKLFKFRLWMEFR
jgi:hypothetical protein